jgi:glycosyltransferase involved in cell wall biosynthesis
MSTDVAATPAAPASQLAALKRVAIVPAYNEELNIVRVLSELRAFDPGLDIVVVSDGSTDHTAEVAEAAGAHVLKLPFNLGIGGAVQTAFRYAWEEGYELVVRVDGDAQHDASQLGIVIAPVLADETDIAVGSRFLGSDVTDSGGYRSSAARRVGIRILPGSSPRSRARR